MKFVILAGGSGTRLWPLSRTHKPKQFTKLMGQLTMYEETIHRFLGSRSADDLYVSTNATFAKLIQDISTDIDPSHFIVEPARRDTGPAMGFVAAMLELTDPDEPIAFIPSDHHIQNTERFLTMFRVAEELIQSKGVLVDVGVRPTFPNVHLGYMEIGAKLEKRQGITLYEFAGFKEKPDHATASGYLQSENYLWHANYYMWTPRKFMAAYEQHAPALASALRAIQRAHQAGEQEKVNRLYNDMEKISIDYAVAEKLERGQMWVIDADLGWSDLGSWDMFYEELRHEHDASKNLIRARWEGIDTSGTVIYGNGEKLIATIGIKDLVIVDTDDALLICQRDRAQEVKKLVDKLQLTSLKVV